MLGNLRHCPECGYDLAGLPQTHRCPECGLSFDATTMAYEGRRGDTYPILALRILLTLWIGSAMLLALVRQEIMTWKWNALVGVLVAWWWYRWLRRRRPFYVLLTETEVIYREGGQEKLRVDLGRVWRAEYLSFSKEIALLGNEAMRIAVIPDLRQQDSAVLAELCAAINERSGFDAAAD